MLKKSLSIIVLSLLLVLLLVLPFGGSGKKKKEESPRYGGVFRLKSFADSFNTELDPVKTDSFIFISEQIFDGLVKLDKNFNIVPSLAEYWEISSDGKTYTFFIRKGIKFHNGRELTAADVKFALERILDKKVNSPFYEIFLSKVVGAEDFRNGMASEVRGFKVRDGYTIEIEWTRPFVSALYLLSMHFCKILPQELVQESGSSFFLRPVGTGPFMFDSFIRNPKMEPVGVRFRRNENYFLGKSYLEAVEFSPHFTLSQFIDVEIESIPVVNDKLLNSEFQIFSDGSLQLYFLGMSCHIAPLDRSIVRRAISFAINKAEIVSNTKEARFLRKVTNNFIPSKLPGYFPTDDEEAYDLEQARKLFQEAGFGNGRIFPILTLHLSLPKTETKIRIYRELKSQLAELGIQLRLKYINSLDEIRRSKNPYLFVGRTLMSMPDPEDIIRPLFFSTSNYNLFGYGNNQLDSLLELAETEPSWTRRTNFFHRIEQILFADMPSVPLYTQQNLVAMQPYVRGVEAHPLGFYYLEARKIWLDK